MDQFDLVAKVNDMEAAGDVKGLADLLRTIIPILTDDDIEMIEDEL